MLSRRSLSAGVALAALLSVSSGTGTPANHGPRPAAPVQAAAAPADGARTITRVAAHLREHARSLSSAEVERTAEALVREARKRGFDPGLVLAIIEIESHFDAFAVSPVGAIGLMQLMPATAAYLAEREGLDWQGERTLFDPATNVTLGIAYLDELRDRFDELSLALAAYNYGPSAIGDRVRAGAPVPGRYARSVLSAWDRSAQESGQAS